MVDFGLPARPIWFSQDPYPPDSSFRVPGSTDRNASPVVANTAPRQDATEGSVPAPTAVAFQGTQHGVTPVDTSTQQGVDKVAKASPAKPAKAPARKLLKGPSILLLGDRGQALRPTRTSSWI
ncbi:hypothetical protein PC117_g13907 [Phytophthora cactorum]|uniref:Uncharacterized protein n=1 Tax=Phytophthora cactorum TaxID=29920 RepID=A0A8T1CVD0_9STRA|nr:hypothetical protein PC117_g13907 [Phytophthora cactorum]KAG4055497.1 hypothetical protein PC123_g9414 [Phytophthora cactorum]